jgi:hypothetical protein
MRPCEPEILSRMPSRPRRAGRRVWCIVAATVLTMAWTKACTPLRSGYRADRLTIDTHHTRSPGDRQ